MNLNARYTYKFKCFAIFFGYLGLEIENVQEPQQRLCKDSFLQIFAATQKTKIKSRMKRKTSPVFFSTEHGELHIKYMNFFKNFLVHCMTMNTQIDEDEKIQDTIILFIYFCKVFLLYIFLYICHILYNILVRFSFLIVT